MDNVTTLSNNLLQEWKKGSPNLKKCGDLLEKIKVALVQKSFLPVGNVSVSVQELKVARDVLEIGVEYSIMVKDVLSFERYVSQLKSYYYDYKKLIGESTNKYKILGMNLLFLLSQNRVADFHTELELLPAEIIQTNVFIRYPLALEQYIMEGRYNKIFVAKANSPAEIYNFFIDTLVETVKEEIAACLEKSYEKISLSDAAKRLNMRSKAELEHFGKKRNWVLNSQGYYVFLSETVKYKEPLPSIDLAEQAIFYARELEMIV
ncbi:26S proteasome non-ATPase regulatory subunit 8 [Culicoides brevitarsis]|uniref:26S proteasome non-ATPase regulatory subunit 8 n=1 Tax=Culicoides brevitarsis TaxID=469753 RepID=UPI00307C143E